MKISQKTSYSSKCPSSISYMGKSPKRIHKSVLYSRPDRMLCAQILMSMTSGINVIMKSLC